LSTKTPTTAFIAFSEPKIAENGGVPQRTGRGEEWDRKEGRGDGERKGKTEGKGQERREASGEEGNGREERKGMEERRAGEKGWV